MTQKEEFLKLQSYEEFDKKRERFKGLKFDKEVIEHLGKIFPKIELFEWDAIFPAKKKEE